MYSYSQVEAALAQAHNIDGGSLGAFRARIKHLRQLGVVPSSPGTGRKIVYEKEHVYSWAFCLELEEFGLDPKVVVRCLRTWWGVPGGPMRETIPEILTKGTSGDDIVLWFCPNLLSRWFLNPELTNWNETPWFQLDTAKNFMLGREPFRFARRHALINLSEVHRVIEQCLAEKIEDVTG